MQWIINKLNCHDQLIFGDIIRYFVTNIHPSNQDLRGDKTKRWEIINHLLISIKDMLALSYSILSLIYDWHFYKRGANKIMLIEPCMLVILGNISGRPQQYKNYIDLYNEHNEKTGTQDNAIGDYILRFMRESASSFLVGHKEKFMK